MPLSQRTQGNFLATLINKRKKAQLSFAGPFMKI